MSQSDFVSRGQALVAAGQFQEAVKVCRLGLLGRPTTVEGRVVLGQALLALKRFDEVLAEMRVALDLDHTSVAAQVLKAEAFLRKGDSHAAIEALHIARQAAPGDPRIMQLLGEAEHGAVRAPSTASHPAVGFVGSGDTKHYPNHPAGSGDEDTGGNYTRPTSVAAPASIRRTSEKRAAVGVPPSAVLAVGDSSGTVEVDPELEGIELHGDADFDELAAPPVAQRAAAIGGPRGNVRSSGGEGPTRHGKGPARQRGGAVRTPTLDLELDDSDVVELAETQLPPGSAEPTGRAPGAGTAVRNAVAMPSGPLDEAPGAPGFAPPRPKAPSAPPPLARALAAQPYVTSPVPGTPQPLPPVPQVPLAASLPTVAALPVPPVATSPAASHPTVALAPAQGIAGAIDEMLAEQGGPEGPAWARSTVAAPGMVDPRSLAASQEPTARPGEMLDPALLAVMGGPTPAGQAPSGPAVAYEPPSVSSQAAARKPRSRLQVVLWVVIGIVVIGGGVFAGFQIRAMRLHKQIEAARSRATDLAKADTFGGWAAARDSLAGIVQASSTIENRAALARARALIAYEFGEGLDEAKSDVAQLGGQGGLDAQLAAAYVGLAEEDSKAARVAADAALAMAANDASASYVVGQAQLLAGDLKAALASLRRANELEARPRFGVGLARALATTGAWDDALAALDKVLAASSDHPGALIARAQLLAESGRLAPANAGEVRVGLEKLIAEAGRPAAEQPHGIAPLEVALAHLALARVDLARGDTKAALGEVRAAGEVGLDVLPFAEEAIATLFALGELQKATAAAERAIATWPTSRRVQLARANLLVAAGKSQDALDLLAKQSDLTATPRGQALRGQARFATGDLEGARADFAAALQKLPNLEAAIVGRAWVELEAGDVAEARKLVEAHYNPKGSSPAITVAYAAVLRRSDDPTVQDQAKALLEKVVAGPPSRELGRAQLELARLDRDQGDFQAARRMYAEAARTGDYKARLESGLVAIEDRDPNGGRDTLDLLLKEAGEHPSPTLVMETARARLLVGDHAGAAILLELADKMPGIPKWELERERGRLQLRKGDAAGAVATFGRALDGCGGDAETFLLGADAVALASAIGQDATALADKIQKLAPQRLGQRPEASIVSGKLLIVSGKNGEAEAAYRAAKSALKTEKASARRLAQVDLGLAAISYFRRNDPDAKTEIELAIGQDPSLYGAYLFAMSLTKDKKKAFELAKKSVQFNPDYVDGWAAVGQFAAKLGDKPTLADAIAKLTELAPGSDALKSVEALRGR